MRLAARSSDSNSGLDVVVDVVDVVVVVLLLLLLLLLGVEEVVVVLIVWVDGCRLCLLLL